ncbi:alpha/beta fold hydrolase [Bacteroides sp.]
MNLSAILSVLITLLMQNPVLEQGYIDVPRGTLYYEEQGSGEPVILIHGHSLDLRMWDQQFDVLAQHFRVIRYDMRGYGKSSSQIENFQFTHAEDLVILMDSLHIDKAHLVGLSLGGEVGADMLGWFPERVKTAVLASGNARLSAGPSRPMSAAEHRRYDEKIARNKAMGVDVLKRRWCNKLIAMGGTQSGRMREPLWTMIKEWDAWQSFHKEVRTVAAMDAFVQLKKNRPCIPVLILEGHAPGNWYSPHPEILNYLPNGRLKVMNDCGHMLNMERPEEFNKIVMDFLRQAKL